MVNTWHHYLHFVYDIFQQSRKVFVISVHLSISPSLHTRFSEYLRDISNAAKFISAIQFIIICFVLKMVKIRWTVCVHENYFACPCIQTVHLICTIFNTKHIFVIMYLSYIYGLWEKNLCAFYDPYARLNIKELSSVIQKKKKTRFRLKMVWISFTFREQGHTKDFICIIDCSWKWLEVREMNTFS